MDIIKWLFVEHEKEAELGLVKRQKIGEDVFNHFYSFFSEKSKILNVRMPKFIAVSEIGIRIAKINLSLIDSIRQMQLNDILIRRILVLSATKLEHVELGIKALRYGSRIRRESDVNGIEEGKRRSYQVLGNKVFFARIIAKCARRLNVARKLFVEYQGALLRQNHVISVKGSDDNLKSLFLKEMTVIAKLKTSLRKLVLSVLASAKTDKREIELRKNSSLSINQGNPALLIFHGNADNPFVMRDMMAYFRQKEFSVFAPRLPGRGTTDNELFNTSVEQVCMFAQETLDYFYNVTKKPVFITGMSLGGMLTLYLASRPANKDKIAGIIPINAYIKAPIERNESVKKASGHLIKGLFSVGIRFLRRYPLGIYKRKLKHAFNAVLKFEKPNYEEELVKMLRARLDDEFGIVIYRKIRENPEKRERISHAYDRMKEICVARLRNNYRAGNYGAFQVSDISQVFMGDIDDYISIKGLVQLNKLSEHLQAEMPRISVPVFVIQSEKDTCVDPISAEIINKSCRDSELYIVPIAQHVLVLEKERFDVFDRMYLFIRKNYK
jgi:esterase/lipase